MNSVHDYYVCGRAQLPKASLFSISEIPGGSWKWELNLAIFVWDISMLTIGQTPTPIHVKMFSHPYVLSSVITLNISVTLEEEFTTFP